MRKNVLEYLESSARMHADKPAFCDENRVFTFGELLKAAQGLGTHLAKTVDTLHKPVAVLIGRTAESVAAMQGVLYAGGCYVPIDDHMPEARIRRIFEQVHPVAIVYAEGNRRQAEPLADCAPLISMDEGFAAPADANLLQSIRESVLDIDPVYLLFTSGSTGAPKGIVIPHRAVIDFTDWMSEFCGYTEHDIFGNQAPFYFDLSCKDLYQTLSLGATCHIFSKKLFTFPMLLLKEMERVGVTAINWATSAFHFVASSGALSKCAPPTLRKAALGGEALQARYVNAWKAAIPGLEVVNMYGPTETTVDCAAFHLTRDYRDDEAIPIGKACRNMQIILLDKDGKPVPDGEAGEICVRGSGLASGYFGNWEKTNECFIQNPDKPVFPRYSVPHRRYRRQEGRRSAVFPVAAGRPDQAHGLPHRAWRNRDRAAQRGRHRGSSLPVRPQPRPHCLHLRGRAGCRGTRTCHAQAGAQVYAAQHLRKAGRTADERQRQDRPCQAEGAIYPCGRLRISHRFPIC